MSDIANHFAVSTGALHASLMFAEISLRVALQSPFDDKRYLRREIQETLTMLQRALKEQRERDEEMNKPVWDRKGAAA